MNSIMQVLFATQEFQNEYLHRREKILDSVSNNNPTADVQVQMSKLADGLLSGRYSIQPTDETHEPKVCCF